VDRLEAMAMLVEAVDSRSLSAVSRKMNVPLPTVSRKIADLQLNMAPTRARARAEGPLFVEFPGCPEGS
jgi:hypothetical protein